MLNNSFEQSASPVVTKIVNNGADGEKLVFAVLGDGYASVEQTKFTNDVNSLVVNGLLGHDFFQDNQSAFNVYRVSLTSKDSGVSTLTVTKDTALRIVYSGDWNRCWLEESSDTDLLVTQALNSINKYDYVLIIANESGFGGCRRGSRLYITSGVNWDVVAHEYGHGVGNLFDEYTRPGTYSGSEINVRNCSTVLDRNKVVWADLITPTTPVPTTSTTGMDSNRTVGMFEGCHYKEKNIYRPVHDCRMKSNTPLFCPVCERVMRAAVADFLGDASVNPDESKESEMSSAYYESGQQNHIAETRTADDNTNTQSSEDQEPARSSYLHLVVRISEKGGFEILKASEISGKVILRKQPTSNFLYEVTSGQRTLAVETLPEDPFVVRGFSDPDGQLGHKFERTEAATIVLKVPNLNLEQASRNAINVRLYEAQPGQLTERITPSTVQNLKERNLFKTQIEFPADQVNTQIRLILERSGD